MARPTHQAKPATAMESFLARLLDPVDRLVEGIYSVLIVLTFTLAFNVYQVQTEVGAQEVSAAMFQLFLAALGCAVAWGLIDGVMYILTSLFERGEQRRLFMAIRSAASEEEAVALLAAELDDKYAGIASAEERTRHCRDLYPRLKDLAPGGAGFKKKISPAPWVSPWSLCWRPCRWCCPCCWRRSTRRSLCACPTSRPLVCSIGWAIPGPNTWAQRR